MDTDPPSPNPNDPGAEVGPTERPTDPPPSNTSPPNPQAKGTAAAQFVPMADENPSMVTTFDTLLKKPGSLLHHLHHSASPKRVVVNLLITTVVCLGTFGLMVGTFSGGDQLWAAPVKIILGVFASALICLPSLYIFACLSGYDITAKSVVGVLAAVLCLTALLLLGFTPVVWVFSQSITSLPFMAVILLGFWIIALGVGLSLLFRSARFLGAQNSGHLTIWALVFVTVALQMSTTLRPIIGTSDDFFPKEKRFFLDHWLRSASDEEGVHYRGSASSGGENGSSSKTSGSSRGWD
jgi:hypothetical protein